MRFCTTNLERKPCTMKNLEIRSCYSPVITASCDPKRMKGQMEDDIRQEIDRLTALDHETLKKEYRSRFGGTATFGDVFMRRRLAQQLQEDRFGGLTPTEIEMLSRVVRKDARANPRASRKANPTVRGVTYTRMYKGRLVCVKVAGYNQFEYEGQLYPALTACVKVITGMHYSGRKFFKLGGAPCNN